MLHPATHASTSTKPAVAGDLDAVRAMGVEAWLRTPVWPLSDDRFFSLGRALWAGFAEALSSLPRERQLIALTDTTILHHILQDVNMRLSAALAQRNGSDFILGGQQGGSSDFEGDRLLREITRAAAMQPFWRRSAARLAKRALFNRHVSLVGQAAAWAGSSPVWLIGSMSPLKRAWLDSAGLSCDAPPPSALTGAAVLPSADPQHWAQAFVHDILDAMTHAVRDLTGLACDAASYRGVWVKRLQILEHAVRQVMRISRAPQVALMGEIGKPWNRAVAAGLKLRGARIVAANHGAYMGEVFQVENASHMNPLCDEVLCYNRMNAQLLARAYEKSPLQAMFPVRFKEVAGTNPLRAVAQKVRMHPRSAETRDVMIVGYPMNTVRYAGCAGHFFVYQLAGELMLAKALKDAGYRVIYKMHPERQREAAGLFDGHVDEIVTERFETIWPRADAFAFASTLTSTFSEAVLTDRPIVAIDFPGMPWVPEVRDLLTRRVAFVPSAFEADAVHFSAADVATAMREAEAMDDDGYRRDILLAD